MFDEMQRLKECAPLLQLLDHYVQLADDNEVWLHRRTELGGVDTRELSRLHGELVAYGWIEQNTGLVPACYRTTPAGRGHGDPQLDSSTDYTDYTD